MALLPDAPAWLGWAGLRLGGTGSAAEVEASLRWKALLLVAVAVKKRTFRCGRCNGGVVACACGVSQL